MKAASSPNVGRLRALVSTNQAISLLATGSPMPSARCCALVHWADFRCANASSRSLDWRFVGNGGGVAATSSCGAAANEGGANPAAMVAIRPKSKNRAITLFCLLAV